VSRFRRVARRAAQLYRAVWRVRPFEGIYPNRGSVPASGEAFVTEAWAKTAAEYTASLAQRLQSEPVPRFDSAEAMCLPFLAAIVHGEKGRVAILDVGGGAGVAYVQVRQVVPADAIEYVLVDNATVLAAARAAGHLPATARFHEDLATTDIAPDIVHAGSVIQYIDDYRGFLEMLARRGAPWIVLTNSPVGDMPTCATRQVNMGAPMAYWFLNAAEVTAILREAGYGLIFSSACERDYDLDNLPEDQRIADPRNLVFRRVVSDSR